MISGEKQRTKDGRARRKIIDYKNKRTWRRKAREILKKRE